MHLVENEETGRQFALLILKLLTGSNIDRHSANS
jgi:hypothetical protein